MSPKIRATIEDLSRVEGKAELLDGEIVSMPPAGADPNFAGGQIYVSLNAYARQTKRGRACTDNAGFRVNLPHRETFSPDVAYHVGPRTRMRLRDSVARQAADTVRRLLVEALAPTVEALLRELPDTLTDAAFEAVADQLANELSACRDPNAPWRSDHAVSRAGIYEDHP